jgi:hypothetical protein
MKRFEDTIALLLVGFSRCFQIETFNNRYGAANRDQLQNVDEKIEEEMKLQPHQKLSVV